MTIMMVAPIEPAAMSRCSVVCEMGLLSSFAARGDGGKVADSVGLLAARAAGVAAEFLAAGLESDGDADDGDVDGDSTGVE
jgi:hypothetical protein